MKSLNRFVLTRVFLALTIAVLVVLTKKEMIWGGFKILLFPKPVFRLWVAFMVLLLLSAIWKVVLEMYRRGMFTSARNVVENALRPMYRKFVEALYRVSQRVSSQFILWGLVIGVIVGIVWNEESLDNSRLNEVRQMPIPGRETTRPEDSPVVLMSLGFHQTTQEQYLNGCLEVVDQLRRVGAKAVLVPFDFAYGARMGKQMELITKLNETGIVVFGNQSGTGYEFGNPQTGEIYRYRGGYFTAWTDEYPWHSPIRKVQPIARRMPFSLRKDPTYDVSFELLRLYYGIPSEKTVEVTGSEVVFGDLRYPIDANGNLIVGRLVHDGSTANWPYTWPRFSASSDAEKGVTYGKFEPPGRFARLKSLEEERQSFAGKIVLLDWDFAMNYVRGRSETYARVLHHMIRGETLIEASSSSLLLAFFAILVCGLIVRKSTPLTAIALVVIEVWLVVFISAWLFQVSAIVIHPVYALAGIALSLVVFSIVRVAHEWRFGVGRGVAVPPISVAGAINAAKPPMGLAFLQKRISFSPAVAVSVLILVIVITALIARGVGQPRPIESPKEVIYVTSLPTVEVQGLPIQTRQ